MSFSDHFSAIARTYAAFRPHYPTALADELASRCASTELAWDAGCGNGQISVALASRFEQVIATEPAPAQLDAAERHPHVEYRCEPAERSSLGDRSVDLAVAAQAAHWFDWPAYVAEVARVTRPGALVALVSYGIVEVDNSALPSGSAASPGQAQLGDGDSAATIVRHYYRDVAGPYWPPGREHVENGYRDLAWPWESVEPPQLAMTARWTRDQLLGYIASWSATVRLVDAQGPAPYETLRAALASSWADGTRMVRWPLTLRLARVHGT